MKDDTGNSISTTGHAGPTTWSIALFVAFLSAGCAPALRIPGPPSAMRTLPSQIPPPAPTGRTSPLGAAMALAATHYLSSAPEGFRDDCSGFVCAVAHRAGLPLQGNTKMLWERADAAGLTHRHPLPEPGDLVFFDNTYDRNRNGRLDDLLTHVAVVLSVERDGTVVMAHSGSSRGRSELKMNLKNPHDHSDTSGKVLNDYLRRRTSRDRSGTPYLTGECWRAFASPAPSMAR